MAATEFFGPLPISLDDLHRLRSKVADIVLGAQQRKLPNFRAESLHRELFKDDQQAVRDGRH